MLVLGSCGGENLVRPTEGTLLITTSTTGSDVDPDGYTLTVDNRPDQEIDIRETLAISDLAPGDHSVSLTGVIQNCELGGAGRRTVAVIAGDTVNVTFRIACESIVPPSPPGGGDPVP